MRSNPTLRPTIEALVDDFPIAETLRKIPPGKADSISEENGFGEQPIIRRCAPTCRDAVVGLSRQA
jgi:hypothetical protein